MNSNYYGIVFAILSPFFSSIATIFKTGASKTLTPLIVVCIGGIIGSIILFSIAKLLRQKPTFKKIKSDWKDIVFVLVLRNLLGELFLTFGLSQTQAIKAIFFTKIEPYFVLIFAWIFLREKVKLEHFLLLTVHLFGALILSTGGNFNIIGKTQIGDLLIIIAMGFFASSYSYGKRLAHNVGAIYGNALTMGVASLIFLPFLFAFSPFTKISNPSLGWTYLLVYVILFNVIGLSLWYVSLKTVKGWMVSALRYIGPVLGAPVAYFLFGEKLNMIQVLGAIVVMFTSFLIVRVHLREKA